MSLLCIPGIMGWFLSTYLINSSENSFPFPSLNIPSSNSNRTLFTPGKWMENNYDNKWRINDLIQNHFPDKRSFLTLIQNSWIVCEWILEKDTRIIIRSKLQIIGNYCGNCGNVQLFSWSYPTFVFPYFTLTCRKSYLSIFRFSHKE